MGYSPKHNYRAKDHLERGNPDKIVRGYELSEDFEAISREVADISYQLGDLQVNVGGGMNLDDLNDVSAALPDRDNLIIWNGTQWVSDSFGFIETALTFQGGYDLTSTAPADPKDGDLYISNSDGTVDASWGPIGGTPVVAGNVVGYAESKGRWYLLGDLSSTAVTSVGEGLGISVEDSKPREPVVSINRGDVDEWYADKEATENRFVDIETNITEIEGDITDIKTDIGDLEVNIENNLQGNYEPKIDPKNSAFNKNFGTNVGEVAQGNHDHNTLYEPIITPKNSAFNKAFGTAAGQVAAGNHNHDAVYIKDAPKDGESYVRKDGGWEKSAGGGGGGGGTFSPRGSREEIRREKDSGNMGHDQRKKIDTINGPIAIEYMYGNVNHQSNIARGGYVLFVIDGMEYRKLSTGKPANFNQNSSHEKSSAKVPMIYAGKLEIFLSTEGNTTLGGGNNLIAGDKGTYEINYWPI